MRDQEPWGQESGESCRRTVNQERRGCGREREIRGFTLIEILIVISIIALLSSFVLVAVTRGKRGAAEASATVEVNSLSGALDRYVEEEGAYPGQDKKIDPETNYFPLFFNAIFGERKPKGPGGRSAPYMQIKEEKISVWEPDTETYRKATKAEALDPRKEKYLIDPWGHPYIYRPNKGKRRETWMHNYNSADIYSMGPNEQDDTITEAEKSDDIGNW